MIERIQHIVRSQKNKLITLCDQAVVSGSNFLAGILLTRVLGIESYGSYAIAFLFVLFCSSIHQAFIISPMLSLAVKKEKEEKQRYFGTMLLQQILFSLLAAMLSFFIIQLSTLFAPQWNIASLNTVLPICIACYLMHDYFRKAFYVKLASHKALLIDCIAYGFQWVAFLSLTYFGMLSIVTAYASLLVGFAISTVYGLYTHEKIHTNKRDFNKLLIENWLYARYLVGTALLQWFSGNFFIITAGALLGSSAVGAIRIAQNIMGVLHVFFLALENEVPVKAAMLYHKVGLKQLMFYIRKVSVLGGSLTITILALLAFFSKEILAFLYGSSYVEYHKVLIGFAIIYVFVFFGTTLRFAIRTVEKNKSIFIAYIFSTVFSLLAAKYMIDHYEIYGVLIGIAFTHIIMLTCYVFSLHKEFTVLWK